MCDEEKNFVVVLFCFMWEVVNLNKRHCSNPGPPLSSLLTPNLSTSPYPHQPQNICVHTTEFPFSLDRVVQTLLVYH